MGMHIAALASGLGTPGPGGLRRLRAGGGRPGCPQDLDTWPRGSTWPGAIPVPAPSGQEPPLAREEGHLAPASDMLGPERRCRVDEGLRHVGRAKETAAGGPEATPHLGTELPGGPNGRAPAVIVGSGRPEGGGREDGPAPQPSPAPLLRLAAAPLKAGTPTGEQFQAGCLLSLVPRPSPQVPCPSMAPSLSPPPWRKAS